MNSTERRKKILNIIEESNVSIKGNELANRLNVSRQIIVQDIALIRAAGNDIVATSQGYIIFNKSYKIEHKIECKNHKSNEDLFDELKTIIDMGGSVKDVIVNHPRYGEIRAELNISSLRDINDFMNKIKKDEFKQLSSLTDYNHSHTIEVSKKEILEQIIEILEQKDIISN
ncbi:MAG: transcription repressor NadR [Bacilli bacterium]